MSKFISVNENGVIYVESDAGDVFGIVSATEITDCDGIKFEQEPLTVLEDNGFSLTQFWEFESTQVDLTDRNGKDWELIFCGDNVLLQAT